jgi:cobalt-zinc-cadmium efflux system outer membrane protein
MVFVLLLWSFPVTWTKAQDTLRLTIEQAEAILIKENLALVAGHYDVDIAEAQVLQAKAWNNPYLNWNQDMYSVELNQYFNYKNQFLIQVDLVFSIAGKHTNTVKLAKANSEMNKLMLRDVMRSLILSLNEQYHTLSNLQQKQLIYEQVLERYRQVIEAGENQLRVGAIAANEVIRLRSEQIALQTEALGNSNQIVEAMAQLRTLLNLRPDVYLLARERMPLQAEPPLDSLFSLGLQNRTDYLLAQKNIQYQEANLKLQRSLAYPDLTFGYQPKDKGSNYVRPYSGLELGFEMPLFNRNTGNIKTAEIQVKKAETQKAQQHNALLNEVAASYYKLLETKKCLANYTESLQSLMEDMNDNASKSYTKRNISLLEYIDLQRIYIQNKMQYTDLLHQYLLSVDYLNFSVGINAIK